VFLREAVQKLRVGRLGQNIDGVALVRLWSTCSSAICTRSLDWLDAAFFSHKIEIQMARNEHRQKSSITPPSWDLVNESAFLTNEH
jgi:hypothetical protein